MTATRVLLVVGLLLRLALEAEGQENLALLQPAWVYIAYSGSMPASKGVDGLTAPNSGFAASQWDTSWPFGPFWVVQLKRWTRVAAVQLFWRNDAVDRRDVGFRYSIGPFWNRTWPADVGSNLAPSDPMKRIDFSLLFTQEYSLYDEPNWNKWFNVTTAASGKYFLVQSSVGNNPVVVLEAQVYGEVNWLMNMTPTLTVADPTPYLSYNWTRLTDEEENTCLTMLDATVLSQVRLTYPITPTGRFVVAVFADGTVQAEQKGTCTSGTVLRVTRPRQTGNAQAADYLCQFKETFKDATRSYHSFVCDCSNCQPGFTVWLSRDVGTGATAVQLCEALLYTY